MRFNPLINNGFDSGGSSGGGGSGDVNGPGSSTDNAVTRFDGTGGKTLQNSGVIISDANLLTTTDLAITSTTASTVPYLDSSKKITSSAVTPTELGYVHGVTSAIQTQLDAKGTGTIGGSTGSVDNAILRADSTGGSTVQGGSKATISDNALLTLSPTGTSGDTPFITFANETDTNPTIQFDGSGNSVLNVRRSDGGNMIVAQFLFNGSFAANNGLISDSGSQIVLSPGSDGTIQAIKLSSTPGNPPAGKNKLYFKNDGNLYMLNPSGTETQVNGGGGSTSQDFVIQDSGSNTIGHVSTTAINDLDSDIQLINTADSVDIQSYGIGLGTSNKTSSTDSRSVVVRSGATVDGNSGDVESFSGFVSGIGNSGIMNLLSGEVTSGTSGLATLSSGTATASGGISGDVKVFSGQVIDTTSGTVTIETGRATGSGVSGDLYLQTGDSAHNSGSIFIRIQDGTDNNGEFNIIGPGAQTALNLSNVSWNIVQDTPPGASAGAGAGSGASATLTGGSTDIAGQINLTLGSGPTSGDLVVVTYNKPMPSGAFVTFSPNTSTAASNISKVYVDSLTSASSFTLKANAALTAGSYSWSYTVMGMTS